jgi:hypothetical protein
MESVLLAFLGLAGGAVAAVVVPAPLAAIGSLRWRLAIGGGFGALCGFAGARPIAATLERPEYALVLAIVAGFCGLAFLFKVVTTWNELELGTYLRKILDAFTPGRSK